MATAADIESRAPHTLTQETDPDLYASLTEQISSLADPYPIYRRLQRDYPVAEFEGLVSVFRYDDVAALLRHPRVSSDDRTSALHRSLLKQDRLSTAYLSQLDDQSFLHRDPPEHTRLRRLVAQAFTPHRVNALRPFIREQVDSALNAAAEQGRLELVEDLAYPLPIEVISHLIGIPEDDRPFVASWPRMQLCCSFEPAELGAAAKLEQEGAPAQAEADRLQEQLTDYFAHLVRRRRSEPGDDLVSALIAAEEDGERLSGDEINATLRLLFVAGYENAVNLVGHGALALLRHPDQWAELRDDPASVSAAVEEVLRYDSPFQFTRRVALDDVDVGGYRIPGGSTIIAWLAAANRDPARFTDPDRFDIHRRDNHHLAFGSGIHACLGGALARAEAEAVFAELTRRLVNPRLEDDEPRYRTDVFRSLEALPITFDSAKRDSHGMTRAGRR
ncbi:cytochrome P450 [Nocardiopsis gilva YIM 90087]|uniref:Cytochrome P450 n=1 Tax=Nocardiopsis gilva YIM 90087 TaxID=1235441 RepID=A0A223SCM4_9ACTN|nr:cytochrome P450 [Nocardiopsis gilva]ASU85836.1 cytochrome P450 [Nocardiopsis gilva YIM 90087]